jgi:uncharacterized phage protein (TIGR02218 family)
MRVATGTFPTWSEAIALADLWTITLISGQVLRWTSADIPISANGQTFAVGPIIKRGNTRLTASLEVDTLDVAIETGQTTMLGPIPFAHAAANGALDGASVKLERAFMAAWGNVSATVHLFEGRVSGIDPKHTEVGIQVKSLLEILDSKWPRNLYQPACCHQLYGSGCGKARASYQAAGTATGGTATRINWQTGKPAGYYDQGVIVFTSGQNLGARRTIKSSTASGVEISLPLPYPAKPGDAFQIVPGCDKTHAACKEKFGNANAFRGFPWVPKPETAR